METFGTQLETPERSDDDRLRPRPLPLDLPRSLDDRQPLPSFGQETEMYDAWQGSSQYLSNPIPAQPLKFDLTLDDHEFENHDKILGLRDSDTRLREMLAAQGIHRQVGAADDTDAILQNDDLSESDKKKMLQKSLHMAASNGDSERVHALVTGSAKCFINVNEPDDEGSIPLIYASCFGQYEVVSKLLDAGAQVDRQDRNQWTPLMWAMANKHKDIAKLLLDNGASSEITSSSGRTALDFAAPNSEISDFLHHSGYDLGITSNVDDFYDSGFSQNRFEQEMEENEMKRRMMMESSMNLEVDLSSLGMDERPESPEDSEEDNQEFVWDRCLNDQMFVFQDNELGRILDIIITSMTPQRSPSQKPVPANVLFLSARYAHYHASPELLATLLVTAMDKINAKVEHHQWDMTVLAFWISNATLLLHYLKKDPGLLAATSEFQVQLVELINEIFILIIRDAERRMDKVLDVAMLDHETIGFDNVTFVNDWKIFRSKPKVQAPETVSFKPPPANKRMQPSPRNITSLLSSTLFVLDLYDIHSVIIAQILAQLFYWIGAELFNHVLTHKAYLARTKAMQIRMNISTLEDWARINNRTPEHYVEGSLTTSGENTVDAARKHLAPVIQLLQWLQCFSSISEDNESLEKTLAQLARVTPQQLLHAANKYRLEVGEKGLPKSFKRQLLESDARTRRRREEARRNMGSFSHDGGRASAPAASSDNGTNANGDQIRDEDELMPEGLLMDPAHMLQFSLPTTIDMRISYGAGYGGMNRERERKYIPSVPPEFLAKLDVNRSGSFIEENDWNGHASE